MSLALAVLYVTYAVLLLTRSTPGTHAWGAAFALGHGVGDVMAGEFLFGVGWLLSAAFLTVGFLGALVAPSSNLASRLKEKMRDA